MNKLTEKFDIFAWYVIIFTTAARIPISFMEAQYLAVVIEIIIIAVLCAGQMKKIDAGATWILALFFIGMECFLLEEYIYASINFVLAMLFYILANYMKKGV